MTVSRPLRKSTLSIASNLFVADQILVALRDILSAITRYHRARIDSHYALLLYRIRPGLTKILPCAPWSGCGSQCPTSFSCNVLVDMGAMHNEHVLHANITFLFFCIPCFLLQWKEQGNDQSPTMLIFHPPLCR